jgi:MFS-type transporter involved in bile tolerance (Atg22 family)
MEAEFNNKSLFGWCLFDFSNSIPAVIGGIYFAKWFTEDLGAGSVMFNVLFFASAVLIMITGKWIGSRIDKQGYKFWITLSSTISIIAVLLLFTFSQFFPKNVLVYISFILFLIFLFGYQTSRICHNVYLRGIIPEYLQSKMSGYGAASNWGGSIVGILLSIPVVASFSGSFGRELTFLVATLGYGVCTPIALNLMFRSNQITEIEISSENINLKTWKTILVSMGLLLLVYLLLFDVMATVQRNLPTYLTSVVKMTDETQAIAFLIILVSALLGGLISAKGVTFINSAIWLKGSSVSLAIAIILICIGNAFLIWVAFLIAGVSYGLLESAIRINFMGHFSSHTAGKNFGVLAVLERTSGAIGPLIWIIPFYLFKDENQAYKLSMLFMAALTFSSFMILSLKRKG